MARLAVAIGATVLVLSTAVHAAVPLRFATAGKRQVWISDRQFDVPPTQMTAADGTEVTLGDDKTPDAHFVHVWDTDRNALAVRKVGLAKSGWTVADSDYTHHYSLTVRCEFEGKPVAAATVDLTAGNVTQSKLMSPDRNGQVVFYAVKAGKVTVRARYNVGDEMKSSAAITYELPVFDPVARVPLVVALTERVATVDPPKPTETKAAEKVDTTAPPSSTGGNLLLYVAGIALAGGLIYAILAFTRKHADALNAKLAKVGVQIPSDPTDAPEDDLPQPVPVAKAPEPIILGDQAVAEVPMGAAAAVPNPRLVRNGLPWLIPDGVTLIGREGEAALDLASESTVSRRHAQIERVGDNVTLSDAGSTNGTYVNGQKLTCPQVLRHGDTVQFGSVQFQFEV